MKPVSFPRRPHCRAARRLHGRPRLSQASEIAAVGRLARARDVGRGRRAWWASFGDPQLTALIDRAVAASPDLAEARGAARRSPRQSRRRGRRALAAGRCQGFARPRMCSARTASCRSATSPASTRDFPLFDVGFDASWELDIWGRNRRQVEAASARGEAAEWGRRDAMVTLIAEVARTYVDLRQAQAVAALAREDLAANTELASLTALRLQAGEGNRIDADQAESQRASSRASLNRARSASAAATYRIATLVGVAPEEIVPGLRASTGPIPVPPGRLSAACARICSCGGPTCAAPNANWPRPPPTSGSRPPTCFRASA